MFTNGNGVRCISGSDAVMAPTWGGRSGSRMLIVRASCDSRIPLTKLARTGRIEQPLSGCRSIPVCLHGPPDLKGLRGRIASASAERQSTERLGAGRFDIPCRATQEDRTLLISYALKKRDDGDKPLERAQAENG